MKNLFLSFPIFHFELTLFALYATFLDCFCYLLPLSQIFFLSCVDPEGKYEALEKYGNDLTELARRGKLDPVIGRDDEIRRCIQILSRRTKNNPVIIGEPGVGKTAIAEGYVFRSIFSLLGNFASS